MTPPEPAAPAVPAVVEPAPGEAPAGQDAHPAVALVQRVGAVVAGAAALVAAYVWFAPLTVPANRGLPFGCGSPAHPNDQQLGGVVCGVTIGAHRATAATAFAVAVAAALVVLALRPLARRRGAAAPALGLLAAVPLVGAGLLWLLTPTEIRSDDGTMVLGCGSAVRPVTDAFAAGFCADVPGSRLATGLALVGAAVLAGVGVPFVWRPGAAA